MCAHILSIKRVDTTNWTVSMISWVFEVWYIRCPKNKNTKKCTWTVNMCWTRWSNHFMNYSYHNTLALESLIKRQFYQKSINHHSTEQKNIVSFFLNRLHSRTCEQHVIYCTYSSTNREHTQKITHCFAS